MTEMSKLHSCLIHMIRGTVTRKLKIASIRNWDSIRSVHHQSVSCHLISHHSFTRIRPHTNKQPRQWNSWAGRSYCLWSLSCRPSLKTKERHSIKREKKLKDNWRGRNCSLRTRRRLGRTSNLWLSYRVRRSRSSRLRWKNTDRTTSSFYRLCKRWRYRWSSYDPVNNMS